MSTEPIIINYNPINPNSVPNFRTRPLKVGRNEFNPMRGLPHIALLIETSREYARGLLRGVARFHQEHGPWSIYFEPHGLNEPPPTWLKNWRGDGILARIDNRRTADIILATGLPAVDVRGALEDLPLPFVGLDNRPICELAYEHLRQCGFQNFAFCGTPRGENPNQDRRCDMFVEPVIDADKYHSGDDHVRNFLDCIKPRSEPAAPVEIGHRTASVCHLGNIAIQLKAKLKWDSQAERVVGEKSHQANAVLDRKPREKWKV